MVRIWIIISLLVSSINLFAQTKCKKEDAVKAVGDACSKIEKEGKAAIDYIKKNLRFCEGNYVWVQDSGLIMVVHPIKPRLDGQPLTDNKDPDGVLLFVEFDKKAKSEAKGGWVDHKWTKPSAEKPTPKTSFVKKCGGQLGWIAGAGVWLEDL